jgi:hypothetical protein
LYRLGRTGRSMVISDTAVGIGKVPEAQLDVRGNLNVDGVIQSQSPAWSLSKNNVVNQVDAARNIVWNVINSKRGVIYDTATGHIIVPITGYYMMGTFAMTNAAATLGIQVLIDDLFPTDRLRGFWPYSHQGTPGTGGTPGTHNQVTGSGIVYLNAGEKVSIFLQTGNIYSGTNAHNQFWGYFIG